MTTKPTHDELLEKNRKLEEEATLHLETIAEQAQKLDLYIPLVENASDLIHSVTPEGDFLYVNQAWRDTLGYSEEEISQLKLMDLVDEGCRSKCRKIFNLLMSGEAVDRNETTFITSDGRKIMVEGRCRTKFKDGKPMAMIGIFRDIGPRNDDQQALRESEERYRTLFENATDIIQVVRPDGRLLLVNQAWKKTFGYNQEDIDAGLAIFDLIAPDCQEHCQETFAKVVSSEGVHFIDTTFLAKDGSRIVIEGNACCRFNDEEPVATQCIFRDVTEKKKMEAELFRAKKLESVGLLAGGIAHDFNNMLTAVLGNISLAKLKIKTQDQVLSRLTNAERAIMQAVNLTQQLLTFSKGGAPIKKSTNITELIKDSANFTLRGANVKCEFQLPADLWPIEVDEGQLSQVSQNLVINACQAMPDGGTLTIMAANRDLLEHEMPPLPAGRYVHLSFHDQGGGISRENLLKIFDPYYTSKETGTGLGLAISYSIITKHDGLITAESVPGEGSTFSIYLPATEKKTPIQETVKKEITISDAKVLLLDDDETIREVTAEMLELLGCIVETAREGEQAIEQYIMAKKAGKPFDAVIMDLTIPGGMGGREAIEKLRAIDPEIRAIVSSGYANDPIMANFEEYGFNGVVAKPYKIEELSETLAKVIR